MTRRRSGAPAFRTPRLIRKILMTSAPFAASPKARRAAIQEPLQFQRARWLRGSAKARANEVEMQILPNVQVTCEACDGKRVQRCDAEIHYRGSPSQMSGTRQRSKTPAVLENIASCWNRFWRSRPRLPDARSAFDDAFRRRGAAYQNSDGTAAPGNGTYALPARMNRRRASISEDIRRLLDCLRAPADSATAW